MTVKPYEDEDGRQHCAAFDSDYGNCSVSGWITTDGTIIFLEEGPPRYHPLTGERLEPETR